MGTLKKLDNSLYFIKCVFCNFTNNNYKDHDDDGDNDMMMRGCVKRDKNNC